MWLFQNSHWRLKTMHMELPAEDAGKAFSLCGANGTQALPRIIVACPMAESTLKKKETITV